MLIFRFILAPVLILVAIFGYTGLRCLGIPAHSISAQTAWLFVGAAAFLFFHALIDLIIYNHAKQSNELTDVPKYRMENKRLLSSSLIVTSGVIIGLTKGSSNIIQLDIVLLAAGILIGFVNLSVHGGSVDDEIDQKTTENREDDPTKTVDRTVKLISVKKFHDRISTWLLNLQIILLILGIVSLRSTPQKGEPQMKPQTSNIQQILQHNRICNFNPCTTSPDLDSLRSAPDAQQYLATSVGQLNTNLTVLAAAEFALVRISYGPKYLRVALPLMVEPDDVWLAITKYDTTDTKPCKTAQRIINGQVFPVDLFLFTGDLQKYETLVASGTPLEQGLNELATKLPKVLQPAVRSRAKYLTGGMWWDFQQLLWRVRLLMMREAHAGVSNRSEIENAVIDFRDKWSPPLTFSGGSAMSGGNLPPTSVSNAT